MTVVNFNNISGINSITAQSTALNFYDSAGGTLSIGASVSGNITGNVTGNLTGNVNSSGVSTFSGGVVVAAGTTAAPSISPTGDSNTGIFFPSADTVAIAEGGVEALRVDSNGRVGINSSIPGYPLDVRGAVRVGTGVGNTYVDIGGDAARSIEIGAGGVTDTGPTCYLDLHGANATYPDYASRLTRSSGANGNFELLNRGTGSLYVAAQDAGAVVLKTNGNDRVIVDSSGYVGINTNNPTKLIEVGAANTTSKFQLSPHGAGWDLASTSGNIAPHYQTNLSLFTGQIGSGTLRWQIDNSGQVVVPFQPSFRAGRNSSYNPGANTDIAFNDTVNTYHHNTGGHYNTSNGRFTCPVAGRYLISFEVIWESLASGTAMDDCAYIYVNGNLAMYSFRRSNYVVNTTGSSGFYVDFGTCILSLNASDYVTIRNRFNYTVHGNTYYSWFAGFLLG